MPTNPFESFTQYTTSNQLEAFRSRSAPGLSLEFKNTYLAWSFEEQWVEGFCVVKVLGKSSIVPVLTQYESVITVRDMGLAPPLTGKA